MVIEDKNGWLREALSMAGKKQIAVAKLWGITPAALNRWIKMGQTLPVERAISLCHFLGWSLERLMREMNLPQATKAILLSAPPAAPVAVSEGEAERVELRRVGAGVFRLTADVVLPERQALPLVEIISAASRDAAKLIERPAVA